jgi:hypothetical protein
MCDLEVLRNEEANVCRVSLLAETRFTTYFCKPVDLRVLNYAPSPVRLGRIDDPVRRSDIGRRVDRIQKALGRTTTENSID